MKSLTPFGVYDWHPEDSQQFDTLSQIALNRFKEEGYQKVRTPIIEYYDVLSPAMGPQLKNQSIRFLNQQGELLILRPDNTLPISRMVGQQLKPNPKDVLKLCYSSPVFRQQNNQSCELELFQAGVEHIGLSSPAEDAAILSTCVRTIKAMGIEDFSIDIGHVDFLNNLNPNAINQLKKGDYLSFGHIPERGDHSLIKDHAYLATLATHLNIPKEKVNFNKGLVRGFHYYTGIVFEVISTTHHRLLASGGRYDQLINHFGHDAPAIGFAIELNAIQTCLGET